MADPSYRQPTQLGFWIVLPVSAQCEGVWLEPQADLPDLLFAGAESPDQAQEADGAGEA